MAASTASTMSLTTFSGQNTEKRYQGYRPPFNAAVMAGRRASKRARVASRASVRSGMGAWGRKSGSETCSSLGLNEVGAVNFRLTGLSLLLLLLPLLLLLSTTISTTETVVVRDNA